MRILPHPALLALLACLGGCYLPADRDPIRYDSSSADVASCRRLGAVGLARTDGVGPYQFDLAFELAPARSKPTIGREIEGPNFGYRVEQMRDAALALGATDLLLSRRIYQDWSYVEGVAYRCRR